MGQHDVQSLHHGVSKPLKRVCLVSWLHDFTEKTALPRGCEVAPIYGNFHGLKSLEVSIFNTGSYTPDLENPENAVDT